jgi:hypothetical protein
VAVKTPLRHSESSADLLREPLAPIGHVEPPLVGRGRMFWSIFLLAMLVAALVVGIVLQTTSAPTWEGDWKDLIVEAPAAPAPEAPASVYTGDWKDLLVETPASVYTGDWKDLVG